MKRSLAPVLFLALVAFLCSDGTLLRAANSASKNELTVNLRATLSRRSGKLSALVLSPGSRSLVAITEDGKTELWNTQANKLIATLDGRVFFSFYRYFTEPVNAFSSDGRTVATMSGKEAKLWSAATGQLIHSLKGHQSEVRSFAFSPDGKTLATASADGSAKLWDVETGRLNVTLEAFAPKKYARWRIVSRRLAYVLAYTDVQFSPDGKEVLTIPGDQQIKLWDAKTGQFKFALGEKESQGKFSPSGRLILTRHLNAAELWDANTGRSKATLMLPLYEAAFSHDGRWLGPVEYSGDKGMLNLDTMSVGIPFVLNANSSSWMLYSPDDQTFLVAAGLYEQTAVLLDLTAGKTIAGFKIASKTGWGFEDYLKYAEQLFFHPNSKLLIGANHRFVRFWEVRTGNQIKELQQGRDPAVVSGDGKLLATTSQDRKNILLWDLEF